MKQLRAEVAKADCCTRNVIALIESYFYTTCGLSDWHLLTENAKSARVRAFYKETRCEALKQKPALDAEVAA